MRFLRSLLFLAPLVTFGQPLRAAREPVDRIVVVVGDEVVLASEVANQIQMLSFQTGERPKTEAEMQKLRDQVLDQMVSDRLFLIEAKKDTSIKVRPEELDEALDEQIGRVSSRFSTSEEFSEALAKEGLTLRDLKKRYREDIQNQLLKQKLIQKKLADVSVSRHEVEAFYENFKDSIPNQPEGAKLAHILIPIKPSEAVEDSVKALANQLRQRILDGADFATISSQYSSLGAGASGGDLGYVSKDDVAPEFSRPAFNLSVGEISGVIRTPFGYHVIKCEGKRDDRLRLRHLLLAVPPSPDDTVRAKALADSLLGVANTGGDFAELAKTFSGDNDTRAQGGELGWFAVGQLPAELAGVVKDWKSPGEYRGPVSTPQGIQILKLLEYQPEKKYSLEEDYDRVKELARQDKTGKLVDKWIAQIKARTYLEYRLDKT